MPSRVEIRRIRLAGWSKVKVSLTDDMFVVN